jgi:hypothetical protein
MRNIIRIFLTLVIVVLINSLPASADRGGHGRHSGHGGVHGEIGLFVGPNWWGPGWWGGYPYYPYYPSPPVIIQQSPEIYVQPAPQQEDPVYWYFCKDPQGYYPYVEKCPKGWMKVVPPSTPSK